MLNHFRDRCYPESVLQSTKCDLENITRSDSLKPNKGLIMENLSIHHPEILQKFMVKTETKKTCST